MAVTPAVIAAAALAVTMVSGAVEAQTVSVEADITVGLSQYPEEGLSAVASQLRSFGELREFQFFVEGAWAGRTEEEGDAFGAAYPYEGHPVVMETYGERTFHPRGRLIGIRGGRYRTPFGIHNRSDYAYSGLLRAPLIRYEEFFALSNTFLEHGVAVFAGVPQLTVETSVGAPGDVGEATRRSGFDSVTRVQGYYGPLMIGASHLRTNPFQEGIDVTGRAAWNGIDFRFMQGGVNVSGEWLDGHPFDGGDTSGWHIDASVHLPSMGPLTAVARIEQLDYDTTLAPSLGIHAKRQTYGARVRLPRGFTAQLSVLHQTGYDEDEYGAAFDAALTYSVRFH